MSFDLKTPEVSSLSKQTPFWSVKTGKLRDNEWGTNIEFTSIDDAQWNTIVNLAKDYSKIRFRNCPTAYILESSHKIQFRFGPTANKPILVVESKNISPLECEFYRGRLIECAEAFHDHSLGFWLLDRQLIWKVDGTLLFIPAFWLPAFGIMKTPQTGMPPEFVGCPLLLPSPPGDIYAIASFCFRALTDKEFDSGNPALPSDIRPELKNDWDSILDPALRKTPTRRPASFEMWKKPATDMKPEPSQKPDRRKIIKAIAVLFVLLVGWYIFVPGLYQRGTGSYVVRYANRSYDRAKWEQVWSTENDVQLYNIGGWDAKNVAVGGSTGVVQRNGHWQVQNTAFSKPYYTDAKTFYAFNSNRPTRLCRFDYAGNQVKSEFRTCNAGFSFCQLDRNDFQFWGLLAAYTGTFLYAYINGEFSEVTEDEKKIHIWKDDKTYEEDNIAIGLEPYHSYGNGKALAFQPGNNRVVRYRNGKWYEHLETTHETDDYGCSHLWAINENNFVLVSHGGAGGMITQFRQGKEFERSTNWPFNGLPISGFLAVWGVSINKFWVLDNLGNVAQFDNENVRRLISGPKLPTGVYFRDAWVSPEGVIYAITEKEVYRLD